ncbi:unnamed protein product [Effrenium voratum]|nr:unnamed protein product [Effrenium voratum]
MTFAPPRREVRDDKRSAPGFGEDTDGDRESPKAKSAKSQETEDELPFWEEARARARGGSRMPEEEKLEELRHDSRLLEAPRRHSTPCLALSRTPSTRATTSATASSPSFHLSPNQCPQSDAKQDDGKRWLQVPSFRPAVLAALAVSGPTQRMLVDELLAAMRRFRGTAMRAWRCDFDKQGVGWVSQAEFARGCRFYQCPAQIWSSCRISGGAGMKFWELDHEEALNLELFEQVIWIRTGFDLPQTWAILDPNNRTALTIQEFVRGCRVLGFEGDAHHIFKGLDHQGLGRVSFHDFEYLMKLCDNSSCSQAFTMEMRLLRSWAVEVCADTIEFLRRLSLIDEHAGGWAQCLEPVDAAEFARRLEVLDYPGNPMEIALQVARAGCISAEQVCLALFGPKQLRRSDGPGEEKKERPPAKARKNPIRKAEWDSSICSGYRANVARPAALRVYFSTPAKEAKKEPEPKMPKRISRVSSNPVLSRPQLSLARAKDRSMSPSERRVRPGELNN